MYRRRCTLTDEEVVRYAGEDDEDYVWKRKAINYIMDLSNKIKLTDPISKIYHEWAASCECSEREIMEQHCED